jgi:hypothetical protein
MHIGKRLLVRHKGKVQEGIVENISGDDLDIRLDNGELIRKKFWEVRRIDEKS